MNKRNKILLTVGVLSITISSFFVIQYFLKLNVRYNLGSIDDANLTVLVDNNPNGSLSSPWGLSMLIETQSQTILFDSGPNPNALEGNADLLGKNLSTVDICVISHEHPDHVDGLTYLSGIHNDLPLYTPYYGSQDMYWMSGFSVSEVRNIKIISPGIAIIGINEERSLVVNIKDLGMVILVGCSHPGVENLVARATRVFDVGNVFMVIGGFHMLSASLGSITSTVETLIELGVQKIAPIHCSGDPIKNFIQSGYTDNYINARVGFQIFLNSTING
jgi:7,8-dihydropterin-6-yl-methyl-4-(beta-D-ribofuranosyl)aminobenzene 5'-phosphate synthase